MIRSLRARLFIGTVLTTAGILGICGFVLYALMRGSLEAEFDDALEAKAGALSLVAEDDDGALKWEFDPSKFPEFEPGPLADYFNVWKPNGQLLSPSQSLIPFGKPPLTTDKNDGLRDIRLPDGRAGRVFSGTYFVRRVNGVIDSKSPQKEIRVVVARGLESLNARLSTLRWLLIAVCFVAAMASVAVLNLVVTALMRPISHLANRISNLDADDLSARFAHKYIPSELRPIAGRLDDLLRRLESAFAREKSFTADVAHELRTPLAGLRATMEVTLAKARSPGRYQEALDESLMICKQMQDLVDNLLSLSQLESGRVPISRQPFDLSGLIEDCWRPYVKRAEERSVTVDHRVSEELLIDSDREKLRLVLRNLFDNAVSYVNDGGRISIEAARSQGRVAFAVTNSGCDLEPQQVQRVFDRFWRAESSRSATGMHCGIGLSLCQKICELLGGSIIAAGESGGIFAARVSLPDHIGEHRIAS